MSDLFTIHHLQTSGNSFSAEVHLDPSHPVFKGHFPGKPVLPGVFLVQIVAEVISKIKGRSFIVQEAANIKFLSIIDPDSHGVITLEGSVLEEPGEILTIDATIRQDQLLFAKMKGVRIG